MILQAIINILGGLFGFIYDWSIGLIWNLEVWAFLANLINGLNLTFLDSVDFLSFLNLFLNIQVILTMTLFVFTFEIAVLTFYVTVWVLKNLRIIKG